MNDAQPNENARARFGILKDDSGEPSEFIPVDFNPVSLEVTVQTETKAEGGQNAQHVSKSSAKLSLELIFDSTDTGEDVRKRTQRIERLLVPADKKTPPRVRFEWGAFKFDGFVDSFKQTLDFFSQNGVPLRAVVPLSLSQPEYVFDKLDAGRNAGVDNTLDVSGGAPSSLAAAGGDPGAARLIASANGLESLRLDAGVSLSVGGGISIGAAAGFSAGAGGGAGIGIGGAFAGLHVGGSVGAGGSFDPGKLLAATTTPAVSAGASFDVSGKASLSGGAAFKADVSGGVRFDEV